MWYKNCGVAEVTYEGISIKPGEVKEFSHATAFRDFVEVFPVKKQEKQSTEPKKKRSVGRPSKASQKQEDKKDEVEEVKEEKDDKSSQVKTSDSEKEKE